MASLIKNIALTFLILLGACINTSGQINGFVISDPAYPANHNLGTSFPINVKFDWTSGNTTSATAIITYDPTKVSYDPTCTTILPACISVTNTPGQIKITIANLASCPNATSSILFGICFKFNCPDSCTGVVKTTSFSGTLTDNLGTTQSSSCTANGILNNYCSLTNTFGAFNAVTGEITYRVCFTNTKCFKIKDPVFSVSLSPALGTITSVYTSSTNNTNSSNYVCTLSGNDVTLDKSIIPDDYFCFYYVVKLNCPPYVGGQTLTTNVTLNGYNCNPNTVISGPISAVFNIPLITSSTASAAVTGFLSSGAWFYYQVKNTGNAPLNLIIKSYIPLLHLTSVTQASSQSSLLGQVQYFDCTSASTGPFPLSPSNSTVPANTPKFSHIITDFQPGNTVDLYTFYNTSSSCTGATGNSTYSDSIDITYVCNAASGSCLPCGNGNGNGGKIDTLISYTTQPQIYCPDNVNIGGCKNVGDTLNICYKFQNIGTASLISGAILNIPLPSWLQAISSSVTYNGFSANPTIVSASNLKFVLPTIPVSNTLTYTICFKAVVQSGAPSGSTYFYCNISGTGLINPQGFCLTEFNICAFAAIGVDKLVKGNLDANYSTTGNGTANSTVDYQVTLHNTGTVPINNLVVIDRIPAIGNLTILGNPNSTPVNSQFNMQMMPAPTSSDYNATYSSAANVCTGWPATGAPCTPGTWASSSAGMADIKFTFTPSFSLAPGQDYTFKFQTKIPAGTAPGLVDCNTVGFIANTTDGSQLNPVESDPVCITVMPGSQKDTLCHCGKWNTTLLNNTTLPTPLQFDSGDISGTLKVAYSCSDSNCTATYFSRLIKDADGSVLANGSSAAIDLSQYSYLPCGNYTLKFKTLCGADTCTLLTIPFTINCDSDSLGPKCDGFQDSTFENWNVNFDHSAWNHNGVVATIPGSGGPNGAGDIYLHGLDQQGQSFMYDTVDYAGDWTSFFNAPCPNFCWDFKAFDESGLTGVKPSFVISTTYDPSVNWDLTNHPALFASFTAYASVTDNTGPDSGWHHYCAPIAPCIGGVMPSNSYGAWTIINGTASNPSTGWVTGDCNDWLTLLQNVSCLRIAFDYTSSPTEEVGYDNLCLGGCPPDSTCCKANINVTALNQTLTVATTAKPTPGYSVLDANYALTSNMPMSEVRVDVDEFRFTANNANCILCQNRPNTWGNILAADYNGKNLSLSAFTAPPSGDLPVDYREAVLSSAQAIPLTGGDLHVKLSLPMVPDLCCCTDSVFLCLKFTFKDTNCVECVQMLCGTYLISPCDSVPKQCNCGYRDTGSITYFTPSASGRVNCGGTITLQPSISYNFTVPTYHCLPSGTCAAVYTWYENGTQLPGSSASNTLTFSSPNNVIKVYARCGSLNCDSCIFNVQIDSTSPACSCNGPWHVGKIGYTFNQNRGTTICNGSFNFIPGPYTFTLPGYTCSPASPTCFPTYTWKVNGVVQPGTGATNTITLTTTSNTITIIAMCNGKPCDSCVLFPTLFTGCVCGQWSNNQFTFWFPSVPSVSASCGQSVTLRKGVQTIVFPTYSCNPDSCAANYNWSVKPPGSSAWVPQAPGSNTYNFSISGTYSLKFIAYCGGRQCDTCTLQITIDSIPPVCNCGYRDAGNISMRNPTTLSKIKCGDTITLSAPATYTITFPAYHCLPPGACNATYAWYNNGVLLPATTASNTVSFSTGSNVIKVYTTCGNTICDSCTFYVNIGSAACGCNGYWMKDTIKYSGNNARGTTNCNGTFNFTPGAYTFTIPGYNCNPASPTCLPTYTWKVNGVVQPGAAATNTINLTASSSSITIIVTCNGKPCDSCVIFPTPLPGCACGHWSKDTFAFSAPGLPTVSGGCYQSVALLQGQYSITFPSYVCNPPSCGGTYNWSVRPPGSSTWVPQSSGAQIYNFNTYGTYALMYTAYCGGVQCAICTLQVSIDTLSGPLCSCGYRDTGKISYSNLSGSGKISCSGTLTLTSAMSCTFTVPAYHCTPTGSCSPTYIWYKNGALISGGATTNTIAFPSGNTTVSVYTKCGNTICDSCTFNVSVPVQQCNCNPSNNFSSYGIWYTSATNQGNIPCNGSISGPPGNYSLDAPTYFCSPGFPACTTTYIWMVNGWLQPGSLMSNTLNFSLPNNAVTVYVKCGNTICDSCTVNIGVDPCSCSGSWNKDTIIYTGNGANGITSCYGWFPFSPGNYTLSVPAYNCTPGYSTCAATYTWKLNGVIQPGTSATNTLALNASSNTITIIVSCNGQPCDSCVIFPSDTLVEACTCGHWLNNITTFFYPDAPDFPPPTMHCGDSQFPIIPLYDVPTITFPTYVCNPASCAPTSFTWAVLEPGSTTWITQPPGPNTYNFPIPGLAGLTYIKYTVICGGNECTCIIPVFPRP